MLISIAVVVSVTSAIGSRRHLGGRWSGLVDIAVYIKRDQ